MAIDNQLGECDEVPQSRVQEGHFVQKSYVERDEASSIVIVDGAHLLNTNPGWVTGDVLHTFLTTWGEGPGIVKNSADTEHHWHWVDSKEVEDRLRERGIYDHFQVELFANIAGRQSGHVDARIQSLFMKCRNIKTPSVKIVLVSSDGDHCSHLAVCVNSLLKRSVTVSVSVVSWDKGSLSSKYHHHNFINCYFRNRPGKLRYRTDYLNKLSATLGAGICLPTDEDNERHLRPLSVIRATDHLRSTFEGFISFTFDRYRKSGMGTKSLETLLQNPSLRELLQATWGSQQTIFDTGPVKNLQYKVLTVQGSTGLGKTTQIPQLLYDQIRYKARYTTGLGHAGLTAKNNGRIMCVQPRRIACTEASQRVLKERCSRRMPWDVSEGFSNLVGYHIGQQCACTETTPIVYCTAGVMVKRLIHRDDFNWDYLIIDEVHERSIDCYLLMAVLLRPNFLKSGKTIILMSATLEKIHQELVTYIQSRICMWQNQRWFPPECLSSVKLQGVSHGVDIRYLEDITDDDRVLSPPPVKNKPILWRCREQFIKNFICDLMRSRVKEEVPTVMLVFLPSWGKIKEYQICIQAGLRDIGDEKVSITKLHSKLSGDKQDAAIKDRSPFRIILSTDIAESSITIPDATVVIDICVQIEATSKKSTSGGIPFKQTLQVRASQDACSQRAGRVGRVSPGSCYRMVTREEFNEAEPFKKAEIRRVSLHELILRVYNKTEYSTTDEDPIVLMKTCMEPPPNHKIFSGINTLVDHNILKKVTSAKYALLPLGRVLHNLPVDIPFGRLIMRASLIDARLGKIAVDLAAVASCNVTFDDGELKGIAAYSDSVRRLAAKRLLDSKGFPSDIPVLLEILYTLRSIKSEKELEQWCARNNYGKKNVIQLELTVAQLRYHLHRYRPLLPSLPDCLVLDGGRKLTLNDITFAIRFENIRATPNDIALLMFLQSGLAVPHVVDVTPNNDRVLDSVQFSVKPSSATSSVIESVRNHERARVFSFPVEPIEPSEDGFTITPVEKKEKRGSEYTFPRELYLISQLAKCWKDVCYQNPPDFLEISEEHFDLSASDDMSVVVRVEECSVLNPLILPMNQSSTNSNSLGTASALFPMVINEHKTIKKVYRFCSFCTALPETLHSPYDKEETLSRLVVWLFGPTDSFRSCHLFSNLRLSCAAAIASIREYIHHDKGINESVVSEFLDPDPEASADNQFDEFEVPTTLYKTTCTFNLREELEEVIGTLLGKNNIGEAFRVNR
eukprot:TRINITY_DN15315_c0_g1_i1.p1 TRINITY_DN15315_c0_g1~~TRINITY_DN15315_c0_g1_i1.p1  ORF type:complete len:1245 (+),score=203.25 TRINITY_DN15315_c0_g1_i1:50-3784(+)